MADEQAEAAEIEQTQASAETEQRETAETAATETTAEQTATKAKVESQETKPDVITREEAKRLADEAVANLQRKYDEKLQANAHNAKLAEALEKLDARLSGKAPEDPNTPPEGFDSLPEPLQRHFLADMQEKRALKAELEEMKKAQRESGKKAVISHIDMEVKAMRSDPVSGKLFEAVENAIGAEIERNAYLQAWMREDPKECLATLFAKHSKGKTEEVKAEVTRAKVEVAKSISQRPSQAATSTQTAKSDDIQDFDAAFERAWSSKVGAGKNYVDQQ